MRFIRKGGRIIPINDKARRVIKGAAKDAALSGGMTYAANKILKRANPHMAAKLGVRSALIFGGASLAIRSALSAGRALKKKRSNK